MVALSVGVGVVAGLRAMLTPGTVSWAAQLGPSDRGGRQHAGLGTDQVPAASSRTVLPPSDRDRTTLTGRVDPVAGAVVVGVRA